MKLTSSNEDKIAEFKKILGDRIEIVKGPDLKEVEWTAREVIIYKSLEAGELYLVEDTILTIDWKEVVGIRFEIEALRVHIWKRMEFIVRIGHHTWDQIEIYRWMVAWEIRAPRWEGWFGFDPFIIPDWETQTLAELAIAWRKNQFSARKIALDNVLNGVTEETVAIIDIAPWEGWYQS